jgi:hypothetical protein
MTKIKQMNLPYLIILVILIVLYFVYKKRFEGFDGVIPDSSSFYKIKNKILQKAAQSNN